MLSPLLSTVLIPVAPLLGIELAGPVAVYAILAGLALLAVLVALGLRLRAKRRKPAEAPPEQLARAPQRPEQAAPELPPPQEIPAPPSFAPEALEEQKKAAYRAKKAAEVQAKEQKRLQAEAELRGAELAAQREAEEQAEQARVEEEKLKKRVAAEAGKTLAEGLSKTRSGFAARLNALFGGNRQIDEKILGEMEEVLFSADIGLRTASSLLEFAREKVKRKDLTDTSRLKEAIRGEVARIVGLDGEPGLRSLDRPHVIMVVGVNGSGKTTTIGKLAAKYSAEGKNVVLAAGDTFRAAAAEQLEVWGQRAKAPVVRGQEGSDPGAVVFDAIQKAKAEGAEVVIADTAGRLHTQAPLMEELKKVKRVMGKAQAGAPHEVLLVLDATNGQNAIAQARQFHEALGVTGIALTKLDGTARGGVIIGICDELKIPVRFVGVGESVADLKPFAPSEFVNALFD